MVDEALFLPDGDGFMPTSLTRGGWSDDAQHGGPPCGLLAHVLEQRHGSPDMVVTRMTTDLVRPVPLTRLEVRSRVVRPGRRIQVFEATLMSGGVEVALATALMIRLTEIDLPERPPSGWTQPAPPEAAERMKAEQWTGTLEPMIRFHKDAVEIRTIDQSFFTAGRGTSWFRLGYPVVLGHETSAFVRTATLADLGNGNSTAVDPRDWLYVNPDVSMSLHRLPTGEWLGMDSYAHQHATGIGLAESIFFDMDGPFGVVTQSQLVERHR